MKLKEEDWNEKLFLCTSHGSWSRLTDVRYQWGTFSNLEIYSRDCNSVFKWAFHNFKIWDLPSQSRNCKRIVAAFLGFYHHFCKEKGLPYVFWLLDLLLYCSYWTWFFHSWVPLDFPSLSVPNWSWGSFLPDIRSQCLLHSLAPELWTWQPISLVSHLILFDTCPSSRLGIPRWISGKRIHLPIQETQETWVQSLGWEDPLKKQMATHFSILAQKIPWTEEPGGLQSMGFQRVIHNWVTEHSAQSRLIEKSITLKLIPKFSESTSSLGLLGHNVRMISSILTWALSGNSLLLL